MQCHVCSDVELCLQCFAGGAEIGSKYLLNLSKQE